MLRPSGRTTLAINIRMSLHKRTIRTLSHCFYDLKYHLVWTPKYRGKVLKEEIINELRRIFETICKWKHWEIVQLNIQDDHIHFLHVTTRHIHPAFCTACGLGRNRSSTCGPRA